MQESLTVAVMSDLHCTHSGDTNSSTSYLLSDLSKRPIHRHPIESLKKVISQEKLEADLLLCPGDISDKVNKQGLISGWQFLQDVKSSLKAKDLMITIGNHDVDSRNNHNVGPFQLIKDLDDFIPTEIAIANDSFWRNNYCIIKNERYILLILNSCSNHTNTELARNSQIPPDTIERIEGELGNLPSGDIVRLAMCHHHPIHHSNSNLKYTDSDFIDQSDKLLLLLEKHKFNLIIHGHKHDPRLVYFNSLTVFAAGSFSSMANLLDIGARNTFHIVKLNSKSKGTITTWEYQPLSGWTQKHDCYFPCFTGFGFRSDLETFAAECYEWFRQQGRESIKFQDFATQFPDINHLIPADQTAFNKLMLQTHDLAFSPPLPNKPDRLYNVKI